MYLPTNYTNVLVDATMYARRLFTPGPKCSKNWAFGIVVASRDCMNYITKQYEQNETI